MKEETGLSSSMEDTNCRSPTPYSDSVAPRLGFKADFCGGLSG